MDEFHRQPAEDVVYQGFGDGDFAVAGHAARFESHMLELADEGFNGNSVLQRNRHEGGDSVHQTANSGAFFGHRDEHFAGLAIFVEADRDVTLVTGHVEFMRDGPAGIGQSSSQRTLDDALDDLLHGVGRGGDIVRLDRD